MTTPKDIVNFLGIENAITNCPEQCNAARQNRIGWEATYSRVDSGSDLIVWRSLWKPLSSLKNEGLIIDPRNMCVSLSDIHNIEIDFERSVDSPSCLICEPSVFQTYSRSVGGEKFRSREFDSAGGNLQIASGGSPQSVGEPSYESGSNRSNNSSKSRDGAIVIFKESSGLSTEKIAGTL
jgi:hypothetical protein